MASPLLSPETVRTALERKAALEADGLASPYQASFLTVARQPEYIHATLQSFLESDPLAALLLPVTLAVGGTDAAYVAPYAEMGLARIFPMTPEETERMETRPVPEGKRVHTRFNTNYHRAMTVGANLKRGLFVFEDDISFTRDWFRKFADLCTRRPELQQGGAVFSLYSPHATQDGPETGVLPPLSFYGTQGVYYPPQVRYRYALNLLAMGVERYLNPVDLLLRDFCNLHGLPIFLARHSLVQHEGMRTTGLSPDPAACHRSPSFVP